MCIDLVLATHFPGCAFKYFISCPFRIRLSLFRLQGVDLVCSLVTECHYQVCRDAQIFIHTAKKTKFLREQEAIQVKLQN